MFKTLFRLSQARINVNVTLLGASVGILGATLTTSSSDSPTPRRQSYKYLVCGGGIAAHSALETLLENNASDLLLVTPEWRSPSPPPTPQSFLNSLTNIFASTPEILVGASVKTIDAASRTATLDDGTQINFQRCLLAVGASMPQIPVGKVVSRNAVGLVSGIQSTSDWDRVERLISDSYVPEIGENDETRAHVTVVGGGWMSPIVGAELIHKGADVTFSYAEPSFLSRYFPRYLAQDVYARLLYFAGGGVDTLSYAAIRYIVARESHSGDVEAEVHVGTVFDAFSIIDFRTDHVVFAPTLATTVPVDVSNVLRADGFVVNQELSVASDIYVAGAAITVGEGAVNYAKGMRWSADHARETGRHAAMNMLGKRDVYDYTPSLTVDLGRLNLQITIVGDVNGSKESFGYLQRSKERGEDTCGGVFERGVLFCAEPAPLSHRGASQRLLIKGMALWDGSQEKGIGNTEELLQRAREIARMGAMTRPELEAVMDEFANEKLGIRLYRDEKDAKDAEDAVKTPAMDEDNVVDPVTGDLEEAVNEESETNGKRGNETWIRPLAQRRKPAPGVVWRRHRSARAVRIREDELLWVDNEWIGAASTTTKVDKMSQAYSDLLRNAARKES